MIDRLKESIIDLTGSMVEPYKEYYSHSGEDMWKWDYPFSKYGKDTYVLVEVGEDEGASYEQALIAILEHLENASNVLIVDRFRSVYRTLGETDKIFFNNLHYYAESLALSVYLKILNGATISEAYNYTVLELIKTNKKMPMTKLSFMVSTYIC